TTRRSPGGASRPARPRGRTESGHILDAWLSLVRRPRAVSPHIAADSPCGSTHVRAAGGGEGDRAPRPPPTALRDAARHPASTATRSQEEVLRVAIVQMTVAIVRMKQWGHVNAPGSFSSAIVPYFGLRPNRSSTTCRLSLPPGVGLLGRRRRPPHLLRGRFGRDFRPPRDGRGPCPWRRREDAR